MRTLSFPLLFALLTAGLTACASTPAAQPAAGGDTPAADAKPAAPAVNRVVMALSPPRVEGSEPRLLGTTDLWQLRPEYEYLTAVDPNTGKVAPQLATSWEAAPDGLSVRFMLKDGVGFHGGGGTVTAGDVAFSLADYMKTDAVGGTSPYFRDLVKAVETPSDREFVVRLNRSDANVLNNIGQQGGGVEIRSAADGKARQPATLQTGLISGTAPYQLESRQQASYIRFKRAPGPHWRVTPDFPEFEFRFIKEASTRAASLLAGEVHLATLPNDLMQPLDKQAFKVIKGRAAGLRTFLGFLCCSFNEAKNPGSGYLHPESPLLDIRVRKALSKAINRDALNKAFFAGKGEVAILNHYHPTRLGWNPEWGTRFPAEYGFDQAAARQLLTDAGYGPAKPLKTTLLVMPLVQYAGAEDLAEAVASAWRGIGVDVALVTMDPTQISTLRNGLKFDNHIEIAATAADQYVGSQIYAVGTAGRGRGVEDGDVQRLSLPAYGTLDPKAAEPAWRALGEAMFTKHEDIPLFWLPVEVAANAKVVGDYLFPGSLSDTWTHIENVKAAR